MLSTSARACCSSLGPDSQYMNSGLRSHHEALVMGVGAGRIDERERGAGGEDRHGWLGGQDAARAGCLSIEAAQRRSRYAVRDQHLCNSRQSTFSNLKSRRASRRATIAEQGSFARRKASSTAKGFILYKNNAPVSYGLSLQPVQPTPGRLSAKASESKGGGHQPTSDISYGEGVESLALTVPASFRPFPSICITSTALHPRTSLLIVA